MKELKIGYLHIAKCGGSALKNGIFDSLGYVSTHISDIKKRPAKLTRFELEKASLGWKFACNNQFVSGHITYSKLKAMKRDFIFTVLRDPRERLFSIYTYHTNRALDDSLVARHKNLRSYRNTSFGQAHRILKKNGISMQLLSDIGGADIQTILSEGSVEGINMSKLTRLIDRSLSRFDFCYSMPLQEIANHLHNLNLIPETTVSTRNVSRLDLTYNIGLSKEDFISRLNEYTWIDQFLYNRAVGLFPNTMKTPLLSDVELLSKLETRFSLNFS